VKNPVLYLATACAEYGWPVFPCQPGQKIPATPHGYLDATTDPAQVTEWFDRHPHRNLAVATGAPGPDVLDIDSRGPAASGFPALARLRDAGLLDGAVGQVRTPSGGLHVYFDGSSQRAGHLPACHVDFLAVGGYVLIPPSQVDGRPYRNLENLSGGHANLSTGRGRLDWHAAARLLEPSRDLQRPEVPHVPGLQVGTLASWVASQPEGNRNAGLFWAANRALETDQAADLSPLAAAARQAGLPNAEITRTLESARRTTQPEPQTPGRQAEGAS
jgi:Bifunctional DNA primase/polymerase, N-terminal